MSIPGTVSRFVLGERHSGEGRLRYLEAGAGKSTVILLHTVRTQAEHFHRLIPALAVTHRVIALDFPGMGHSEIVPGAKHDEPALRAAVARLLRDRDLTDAILVGESIGGVVALSVAADMPGRVSKVVAINPYDYAGGIRRSGILARSIVTGVLTPGIGQLLAGVEPKPVMRRILHGGLVNKHALTDDYLDELLAVGRRAGYPHVARAVYGNLPSMIAARNRYPDVIAPVSLVYGEHDWSRPSDRAANQRALPHASLTTVPDAAHFIALERPDLIADLVNASGQP